MNTFKKHTVVIDNIAYEFEAANFPTYCLVRGGGEPSLHPGWNVDENGEFVRVDDAVVREIEIYCKDTLDCAITEKGQQFCAAKILEIIKEKR
jgi:hypothetical protein